ncbi:MAG: AAA family ATPase [Chloroflexota bacterium]
MESLSAYIPIDRRWAMTSDQSLPDRTNGAVLFLDISGFTSLTDTLVDQLGEHRGVDELTLLLNEVYGALITEVHQYGGSVIGFSGDAITCWFDQTLPFLPDIAPNLQIAVRRATTCALTTQHAMERFHDYVVPGGVSISLGIKAAIACGPVRRFSVGDPQVQLIDVLAGDTLDRMAAAEKMAQRGDVVLGPQATALLEADLDIAMKRSSLTTQGVLDFAVINGLKVTADSATWPNLHQSTSDLAQRPLTETEIRSWLLPLLYERFQAGQDEFLAELRRTYPLFVLFEGIDYEDDDAGAKLNTFVCQVQHILNRYGGYLIQLTTGDKGTYFYSCFGAPVSHDDDAIRAAAAATSILALPNELDFINHVQLGLSQGRMRSGPCGSTTRRTYGVLGDEVNMAARLMELAKPGQILTTQRVAYALGNRYSVAFLEEKQLRGRDKALAIFTILDQQASAFPTTEARTSTLTTSLDVLQSVVNPLINAITNEHGQVLYLNGRKQDQDKFIRDATPYFSSDVVQLFLNDSASDGAETQPTYGLWHGMFRQLMQVPDSVSIPDQIDYVFRWIEESNEDWVRLTPLLGDLLTLPIPDNSTTAIFDVSLLRQGALFAFALEIIQHMAQQKPLAIVLRLTHTYTAAAQRLTTALTQGIGQSPVLLIIAERDGTPTIEADLEKLSYASNISLPLSQYPTQHPRPRQDQAVEPLQIPLSILGTTKLIGRETELHHLTEQVEQLQSHSLSATVLIEGEAGIGKSRLIAQLLVTAVEPSTLVLIGSGDAIEQSTPYHAWRPIFRQFFKLDTLPDDQETRAMHVLTQLPTSGSTELFRLAPLLNTVLSLELPENEFTRQMSGQIRAENTRLLLVRLLHQMAQKMPLIIILEDAHWLDSASWALVDWVRRDVNPVLLMIASRPLTDPLPTIYQNLQQAETTHRLILDTLTLPETLALVQQKLGVDNLPQPIADLIARKAEGHPFFSEELAYALRDQGVISIKDGRCELNIPEEQIDPSLLPDTIEGIITSRIDRLEPAQQLTLKIASVIGRVFPFETLYAIHPGNPEQTRLNAYLDTLERLDITLQESPQPDLSYIFKHIITQEVAYNLMVFNQRQQLHRTVANWYETTYAQEPAPWYPLLAYHWQKAGETPQALIYLEKAGEQALYNGVYQEALRFIKDSLELASQSEGTIEKEKLAYWHRLLGEAYLGLGKLIDSRTHYEQALLTLGERLPEKSNQAVMSLIGQVIGQVWHRILSATWSKDTGQQLAVIRPLDDTQQNQLTEAARSYEQLTEIYFYANQTILSVNAALRTLNLAENAGTSPELVRAYANMVVGLGLVPIRPIADFYQKLALDLALEIKQQTLYAYILSRTSLYHIVTGSWFKSNQLLEQAIEISSEFRDWRRMGESLVLLAMALYGQGNFSQSQKLLEELYELGKQTGNIQHQAWALNGIALFLWHQGQAEKAITVLEEARPLFEANYDMVAEVLSYEVLALAYLRVGQTEAAQQANAQASTLIAKAPPTPLSAFVDYIGVAMVSLTLWEQSINQSSANEQVFAKLAQPAARSLQMYTWLFPVGQTRVWQILGQFYWLSNKPEKAQKAWRKSLALAEKMKMPYEQATVHYQIGRHLAADDPKRSFHLAQAEMLYSELEATYDLSFVKMLQNGQTRENQKKIGDSS